eukprot:TRINITY_DN6195_c1_g1_i1.p1 TRINITY_DN6195_c1_g1~~TRINITY_DN6195_c1_g1_i1.p1  ORF type:complete len:273 (+),score=-47.69 TRINITY_DN6195_c1_g1_i1:69-821(+)
MLKVILFRKDRIITLIQYSSNIIQSNIIPSNPYDSNFLNSTITHQNMKILLIQQFLHPQFTQEIHVTTLSHFCITENQISVYYLKYSQTHSKFDKQIQSVYCHQNQKETTKSNNLYFLSRIYPKLQPSNQSCYTFNKYVHQKQTQNITTYKLTSVLYVIYYCYYSQLDNKYQPQQPKIPQHLLTYPHTIKIEHQIIGINNFVFTLNTIHIYRIFLWGLFYLQKIYAKLYTTNTSHFQLRERQNATNFRQL